MKHKFKIEIQTGNQAFEENGMFAEISRILGEVSDSMASGFVPEKLVDLNGNRCGVVEFVREEHTKKEKERNEI